jgi:hypothetical protein
MIQNWQQPSLSSTGHPLGAVLASYECNVSISKHCRVGLQSGARPLVTLLRGSEVVMVQKASIVWGRY